MVPYFARHGHFAFVGIVLGFLISDFAAGLVHWFADTWGTVDWKWIGPTLLHSFREHHYDPFAITKHSFIETNGRSAVVLLPFVGINYFLKLDLNSLFDFLLKETMTVTFVLLLLTNQFHKWAHEDHISTPLRMLQWSGLILSKEHHMKHHYDQHNSYYCITSGWFNPILDNLKFFRLFEAVISRWTGLIPRDDSSESALNCPTAVAFKISSKGTDIR
jgi:ubiquitin-conjugating enzyme E2 variant